MPRMGDIFADTLRDFEHGAHHAAEEAADLFRHGQHPYAQTTPPPAETATIVTTQEAHMSLGSELHAFADRVEKFDENTLAKVEDFKATPEGAEIFELGSAIVKAEAGSVLPAGTVATVKSMLKGIASAVTTAASEPTAAPEQPVAAPTGPLVSGQAQ